MKSSVSSDIGEFNQAKDKFVQAFTGIPLQALTFRPMTDDYSIGGLIVHVIDVIDGYVSVLHQVLDFNGSPVYSKKNTSESYKKSMRDGISLLEKEMFLKRLNEVHSQFCQSINKLDPSIYSKKVDVYYDKADKPYPTSPSDLLKWLKDHYLEHTVPQIEKLLRQWQQSE